MHSESASNSRGWPGPEPGKCVVNPFLRRQERNVAIYFPLRPGHKLAHLGLVAGILSQPGAGGEDSQGPPVPGEGPQGRVENVALSGSAQGSRVTFAWTALRGKVSMDKDLADQVAGIAARVVRPADH